MLKEIVTIEDVANGKAKVKFERKPSCSCCRIESVCAQGKSSLDIDSEGLSLKKGDQIEVAIDERMSLLAAFLTFFVPAAIFVISLAGFKGRGELNSFFLALVVVCVYYLFFKLILKTIGSKFKLKILGIVLNHQDMPTPRELFPPGRL